MKKPAKPILFRVLIIILGFFAVATVSLILIERGFPAALRASAEWPRSVRIDNVRVLSMSPDAPMVQEGLSVLIRDASIVAIGPSESLHHPADALRIDGAGQTLLPGLIDAHVHVWDEAELAAYLAHGVTSVRNMSGMPFHLRMQRRIADGQMLGPDFETTGRIINSPGRNAHAMHRQVHTAEEARAEVRAQYEAGYRTLKVYSNLYADAYAATLEEARGLGMRITGHTPEGVRHPGVPFDRLFDVPFEAALDDGFVTIELVESIVWHGLSDQLDESRMRTLAQQIAAAKVTVTPTLIAHDNLIRVARSRGAYLRRPGTDTLNPLIQWIEQEGHEFWSAQDADAREGPRADFHRKATLLLHEAGVRLVAGTDAGVFTNIPGESLIQELELLVAAGLTEYQALATATANSGVALGLPDRGQVAPGFRANLVLVPGDPLADISVLARPSAVMIGGRWLDGSALARLREASRKASVTRGSQVPIGEYCYEWLAVSLIENPLQVLVAADTFPLDEDLWRARHAMLIFERVGLLASGEVTVLDFEP